MSFEIIKNKVIDELLKSYCCNSEDELQQVFQQKYLLDYDIFIKQVCFEVYYENYLKKSSSSSIASLFDGSDVDLADNPNYKKKTRAYKKYRAYQDKMSIDLNNGKDVQLKTLKHGKESFNGYSIYKWQENQLENLVSDKYKIFKEITKGTLGDVNRLSNKKLIEYLEEYGNIYSDIENQEENFFCRSFQYYQLEIGNRIETWYMVANKLNNFKITNEDKRTIVNELKCLNFVRGYNSSFQNKFIIGLDKYIDYHINANVNNIGDIDKVYKEIYELSKEKYRIKNYILEWINQEMLELDYNEYNHLCKDYLCNMQYINKYKNWSDLIKTFRLAFK